MRCINLGRFEVKKYDHLIFNKDGWEEYCKLYGLPIYEEVKKYFPFVVEDVSVMEWMGKEYFELSLSNATGKFTGFSNLIQSSFDLWFVNKKGCLWTSKSLIPLFKKISK